MTKGQSPCSLDTGGRLLARQAVTACMADSQPALGWAFSPRVALCYPSALQPVPPTPPTHPPLARASWSSFACVPHGHLHVRALVSRASPSLQVCGPGGACCAHGPLQGPKFQGNRNGFVWSNQGSNGTSGQSQKLPCHTAASSHCIAQFIRSRQVGRWSPEVIAVSRDQCCDEFNPITTPPHTSQQHRVQAAAHAIAPGRAKQAKLHSCA